MLNPKRLVLLTALFGLLVLVAVTWWQQAAWSSWYYARKLSSAQPEKRIDDAAKLERLGLPGAEATIDLFRSPRERACQNAAFALEQMLTHWGAADPRYEATLQYLAETCVIFSPLGQRESLLFLQQLFAGQKEATTGQILLASRLLSQVGAQAETRLAALDVCTQLFAGGTASPSSLAAGSRSKEGDRAAKQAQGAVALETQAKAWVVAGLKDENPAVRAAAIRLAVVPNVRAMELLPPLLLGSRIDPSSEVRQLVILALGGQESLLPTDQLCRFLNDDTTPVRLASERALRARGLSAEQVRIGGLMYNPDPSARAEVAALVCYHSELNSLAWLERLSRDPVPAVRAAAIRAMSGQQDQRALTLIRHLAQEDSDPTVQEIARYFIMERTKSEP